MVFIETIIKILTSILTIIYTPNVLDDVNINKNQFYNYENKHVYSGNNPDNYIYFNNELWRILYVMSDGTIKIIKNESIGKMVFDKDKTNNWDKSTIRKYLNEVYYQHLDNKFKPLIVKHNFNIGSVYNYDSLDINVIKTEEKKEQWNGYVGLITVSEFLQAGIQTCSDLSVYWENYKMCNRNNYISLTMKNNSGWTMSKDAGTNNVFYIGMPYFPDVTTYENKMEILPVVYLNKNIILKGTGNFKNPYVIKNNLSS